MTPRTTSTLLAMLLLSSGLWLTGCGEPEIDSPLEIDESSEQDDDINNDESNDQDPDYFDFDEDQNQYDQDQDNPIENYDDPDPDPATDPGDVADDAEFDFDEVNANQWIQISPVTRPVVSAAKTDDYQWILTAGGRLYRSTVASADGNDWDEQYMGAHSGEQITTNNNDVVMVTDDSEFVKLSENEGSWYSSHPVDIGYGRTSALISQGDEVIVSFAPIYLSHRGGATHVGGGLLISKNSGSGFTDWFDIGFGLPDDNYNQMSPPVYAVYATSDLRVVVGYNGIYRFTTQTEGWEQAAVEGELPEFLFSPESAGLVRAGDALFAAIDSGDGLELRRSDDDGESFTLVDHSLEGQASPTTLHAYGSTLLIGTQDQGVLASNDGGESWTAIGTDFNDRPVRALYTDESTLQAATSGGLMELSLN